MAHIDDVDLVVMMPTDSMLTGGQSRVLIQPRLSLMLAFNPSWKNHDPRCTFPPKVQPVSSFGALIFYLRTDPSNRTFTSQSLNTVRH